MVSSSNEGEAGYGGVVDSSGEVPASRNGIVPSEEEDINGGSSVLVELEGGVWSFIRRVNARRSIGLWAWGVPPFGGKFVGSSVKGSSINVDGKETKAEWVDSSDYVRVSKKVLGTMGTYQQLGTIQRSNIERIQCVERIRFQTWHR